jgi:ABC-type ATPase involved in cell division
VGIARALYLCRPGYADPAVLIVDEPTANLDRRTADGIIELLVGLRDVGRGLLVASHDEHLVQRANDVVRLD